MMRRYRVITFSMPAVHVLAGQMAVTSSCPHCSGYLQSHHGGNIQCVFSSAHLESSAGEMIVTVGGMTGYTASSN